MVLRSANPGCKVHILISKKHHNQEGISALEEEYQQAWHHISDQDPPETEIVVVGIESSGKSPIVRWISLKSALSRVVEIIFAASIFWIIWKLSMWRDLAWVLDMLQSSRKILEYAVGLDEEQFRTRGLHQDAILRQLTIVGEAAKRVSVELRASHPEVPCRQISGFRDVVVHEYARVDLQEVWRIVREDLPTLVALPEPLIPPNEV